MERQRALRVAGATVLVGVVVAYARRRRGDEGDAALALLELLAALGDLLSAYQDAVAEEGYLGGRPRPCSLRRCARQRH
jgi:hypothetical protein